MAHYQRGTRIQSAIDFRRQYSSQSESRKYRGASQEICNLIGITPSELADIVLEYVNTAHQPESNLRDLAKVMEEINRRYDLGLEPDDETLYEAVKGLPFFSNGRLGYTFNRRRRGENRGVFLFSL